MNFVKIDENHFSKKKSVKFSPDTKLHDGASIDSTNLVILCKAYFNRKSKFNIINMVLLIDSLGYNDKTARKFLLYCHSELSSIYKDLFSLKKRMLFDENPKVDEPMKGNSKDGPVFLTKKMLMLNWEHEFWEIRSAQIQKSNTKIVIARYGNRGYNFALDVGQMPNLKFFLSMIEHLLS